MVLKVTRLSDAEQINIEDIELDDSCIISIDASTDTTGVCIVRCYDSTPLYSISMKRGKGMSAIEYKIEFKQLIAKLILQNRSVYRHVKTIVQEEPFISAMKNTTSILLSLRTSVPELLVERKDLLSEFNYVEMNNKAWKKEFFKPDKLPNNSEQEKKMARIKLECMYNVYNNLTQDEVDAACMGIVSCWRIATGQKIESKKPARKFTYDIEFIGSDSIEDVLETITDLNIPSEVIKNGVSIISLPSNGNLDKKIYSEMGDEDKVLIFKMSKKTAGNLVLKYRLYDLANMYDNIYGVVWRKNRKK